MKKVEIYRPEHIMGILIETVKEFNRRGYDITLDQAHALNDLEHWHDHGDIKANVNSMMYWLEV